LNPLIIDYFFRSSVNILNCLESLYYHSTWRFTKYRWSLTSKDAGAKRRRQCHSDTNIPVALVSPH
jgi:hypothetical protein